MTACLAFHAERLHEDAVWSRLLTCLGWLSRRQLAATFFVYPFRAQVVGRDIGSRVHALAAAGHEIAQHTHFYAGERTEGPGKQTDVGPDNVARCVERDHAWLSGIGTRPAGFSAGSWLVNRSVLDVLVDLGLSYDCSALLPASALRGSSGPRLELAGPQPYGEGSRSLVMLPTTASVGQWFKGRWSARAGGPVPYQLVYLHDYDLLRPQTYALLWLFLLLNRRRTFVPADVLARTVGPRL